jgi:NitT/TauT family transport system substrate-binding protein
VCERRPSAAAIAFTAAVALTVSGCSWISSPPERLTLGIVELPATGLVHVARHAGMFEAAKVDVRYVSFPSGRDALTALLDGRVDIATTFSTPIVARALSGDTPRILTTLHRSSLNTRLIVPKNGKVSAPEDLRGLRVAVPRGTSAEYFLETLVTLAGVDHLEVKEIDVRPQDAAAMLGSGQVDAAAVWYPWAMCGHPPIEALECRELFADGYNEVSMIVTRDDVLDSRREALKRFLRALSRAEELVFEEPDSAVPALEAELPDRGGPHLADSWRRVTPQLGLDNLLLTVLDREADWMVARMDAPTPAVDFRALLRPELLLEIEPSAVTLLSDR